MVLQMKERQQGVFSWIIRAILWGFTLFQLSTAGFGLLPDMIQRSIHVCFALALTFLLIPAFKGRKHSRRIFVIDISFVAMSVLGCGYIIIEFPRLIQSLGVQGTNFELFLGTLLTILILETSRRNTGFIMPMLAIIIIAYGLWGHYLPGKWSHPRITYAYIIEYLYLDVEGIWGFVTGLSASLVAAFVIFGAVIQSTGAGDSFLKWAIFLGGRSYGGAAKMAVFSSALFGMISGSAMANVATTGNFTIPMMKRLGYQPEFAGAVEATASSGGQITPPIMGAGAFIMAELINLPYLRIALAGALPAFLFYLCIWFALDFEARKTKSQLIPKEIIPHWREVFSWKNTGPLALTVGVLFYFLFMGYTPAKAAFYSVIVNSFLFLFVNDLRWNALKNRLKIMLLSLEMAGKSLLMVASIIACAQIVISMVAMTGLGIKLSEAIISASAESFLMALFLSAAVALILGMGIPTTAAYLLSASVVGPALMMLGLDPLPAHMFIFYYAILSGLTPPVCTVAYAAAGIAEANWMGTAMIAIRLAIMKYVIPFFFIFRPSILFIGSAEKIIETFIITSLSALLFAAGTIGYFLRPLNYFLCGLLIIVGFILIVPGIWLDLIGALSVISLYLWQKTLVRREMDIPKHATFR